MIDKISLHTQDFAIRENKLRVYPGSFDYETGELLNDYILYRCNGEDVNGSRACKNLKDFTVNVNINGMQIIFNPAKVHYGNNYYSVDYYQNAEVLKSIKKQVHDFGIDLDFDRLSVDRLDLQKTIPTDHIYNNYTPVFEHLHLSRTKETDYKGGYLFYNGRKEICFYDKIREMKERRKDKVDLSTIPNLPDNVLRCEFRAKDSKMIRKDLGIHNLRELNTRDAYHSLYDVYNDTINGDLFKGIPKDDQVVNFKNEIGLLSELNKKYKRGAVNAYVEWYALKNDAISLETLRTVLTEYGYHRTTVQRALDRMYSLQRYKIDGQVNRKISVYELGLELRTKLSA